MHCPADNPILQTHEGSGQQVFFCETCHGLWLNREQLARFVQSPVGPVILPQVKAVAGKRSHSAGSRLCPSCEKTAFSAKVFDGVEIDFCRQCHGVWLDAGELDLIVARYRRKQKLANVADSTTDLFADIVTDPGLLSDLTEALAEALGKSSEWAADAGPALLEFIGDALSSIDF